jgi:hypothetical protein
MLSETHALIAGIESSPSLENNCEPLNYSG